MARITPKATISRYPWRPSAFPILAFTLLSATLCSATLAPSRTRALSELNHTSWTTKDGVPGEVMALAQTTDGYLWIGTASGLYRFDGASFEKYEPLAGQKFPSQIVESLLATLDGGLFIGFRNRGASFLKDGKVTTYGESEGMPSVTVRGLAQGHDSTVWAATSVGLFRLEASRWQQIGKDWNYPSSRAQTVFVDRSGTLWTAGHDAIFFLPQGQHQFQETAEQAVGRAFEVNRIVQAPDGKIWMSETSLGVRPIRMAKITPPPPQIIVGSYGVLFDDAGSLWIASLGDGIGRIRFPDQLDSGKTKSFREAAEIFSQKDGLSSDYVSAVLEDREGNIWVGTSTGLDRFQESNVALSALPSGSRDLILIPGDHGDVWTGSLNRPFTHIEGRALDMHKGDDNAAITCGFRDPDGTFWIGGPNGIWHVVGGRYSKISLPQSLQSNWTVALARGRSGTLWAVFVTGLYQLSGGIWMQFGKQQGLPDSLPTNMFTDAEGRVWLGYLRGRLGVIDGDKINTLSETDGIAVGDVLTIYERGSHLWVGGELGLQLFQERHFRKINAADAGTFNAVSGIVETPNGDLWLNTANGISHVLASEVQHSLQDPSYLVLSDRFDYVDGLPGTSASLRARPTAVQGTDGRLWFSVANGMVWVDPNHLIRNSIAPPVYLSSLTANGKKYLEPTNLSLPAGITNIQITYTALSLTVPERVRFRYKLDGVDQDWQDPGIRRQAFYTNLSPGLHRFQVLACNNDGVWNKTGATLEFSIAAAFYQTKWFLAICIVATGFLAWTAYEWRIRSVSAGLDRRYEDRLAERTRIARELHDTLLQSFQGLMFHLQAVRDLLPGQPTEAVQILGTALDRGDQAIAEGRDAVQGLRSSRVGDNDLVDGLTSLAQEFADPKGGSAAPTLRLSVEGRPRALDPILRDEIHRIAREALRNAFRHAQAKKIEAEVKYSDRLFRLRIRDDGRGIDPGVLKQGSRAGHWGLTGMRERAKSFGGQLDVWSQEGAGTEVELTIPVSMAAGLYSARSGFGFFLRKTGTQAPRT
jgi:signal transduction histidine kinase/ligand-binding sensor domain-containing protein